jgi:hypothetical protein
MTLHNRLRQFVPAQSGHHDVGQQHFDLVGQRGGVSCGNRQPAAAGRLRPDRRGKTLRRKRCDGLFLIPPEPPLAERGAAANSVEASLSSLQRVPGFSMLHVCRKVHLQEHSPARSIRFGTAGSAAFGD